MKCRNRFRIPLGSLPRINKDRTAGIEPRCDFLTVIRLLNLVIAIATAWDVPRLPALVQQRGVAAVAASGGFCGLQITDFDRFLRFFLCHFILLSIALAFRELSS